ncbi:murein DD-endopeptidase MepM [Candidatus Profftia sp. (ex Adelges kitamiensis)]|uniref:murein DD-endopeptidase MepM n=1 Tax=Candidatus Profftia sp. (ex Adelges kitamiensis) TaxID=2864218 RepID=UPI001CE26558|nr:murein DD-endopeptidase MepM [Candidatus Profftia sp. (ex Adelges kitamiensis)]
MQQIARTIALAYNNLPRKHRIMLELLTVITLAISIGQSFIYQSNSGNNTVNSIYLDHKQLKTINNEASEPIDQPAPENEISTDELEDKTDNNSDTHDYIVTAGDTLGSILTQFGMDISDVYMIAKNNLALRNIKIGQTISWTVNNIGELQQLKWKVNSYETRLYTLINGKFQETIEPQQGEWKNKVFTGKLKGSFVNSARIAGLSYIEANVIIKILQWQMDFRKLHQGDQFAVLISREELDGRNIQSQLLGIRINTGGKDFYAIRAEDGKFYDRQGGGLAKVFMRFPTIKHFRISSNFNPRRVNPVTGRIAPHRGVDFAMPVGTPVFAVGDGEIIIAKHGGAAGNYIVIRHGSQYTTRFMHLKKILVKPGQKVKCGDRIALSGNTGRSTGPHLHYEFWLNNHAVNPLTAQLPNSYKLSGSERRAYLIRVSQVVPKLQNFNISLG